MTKALLLIGVFCAGLIAGFVLRSPKTTVVASPEGNARAIRAGGYQFINPLLDYEQTEDSFVELRPFEQKIADFTDKANRDSNSIDFISVYFRDLNNGPWFGVNEAASFTPASLLKVPLMMAYYKISEADPQVLNESITITEQNLRQLVPNQQTIIPESRLEIGNTYTVDELIRRMIEYSDNDAAQLLLTHIDIKQLEQIYNDFGIELPNADSDGTQVSVRTYAGFFRILFNASYLSKADSEKALKLLSESQFKDGLVVGIPADVIISHKFGERIGDNNERQLHDCGIVYYPDHPYLLCVMTRGNDLKSLSALIRQTSQLVYQEVDNQYKGR